MFNCTPQFLGPELDSCYLWNRRETNVRLFEFSSAWNVRSNNDMRKTHKTHFFCFRKPKNTSQENVCFLAERVLLSARNMREEVGVLS